MCRTPTESPTAHRFQPSAQPTTDFKKWLLPTWECFGDVDGNTCEPRWRCPESPTAVGQRREYLDVVLPRVLFLSLILFL